MPILGLLESCHCTGPDVRVHITRNRQKTSDQDVLLLSWSAASSLSDSVQNRL